MCGLVAGDVREFDPLVIIEIVGRRLGASRKRPPGNAAEIGDGSVSPPFRLVFLDAKEGVDLCEALGVYPPFERTPGRAHVVHLRHPQIVTVDKLIP